MSRILPRQVCVFLTNVFHLRWVFFTIMRTMKGDAGGVVDFLIVGAGVYGTSVAASLAACGRGYSITVVDRSSDGFVAKDGASHDLNKIIRADYTNSPYSRLAKQAISCWRTSEILAPFYHETGVLFRSGTGASSEARTQEEAYVERGVQTANDVRDQQLETAAATNTLPVPAFKVTSDAQLDSAFASTSAPRGPGLRGFGDEQTGYLNPRGGWAEANAACRALLSHAKKAGVHTIADCIVDGLLQDPSSGEVIGVNTVDGRAFYAKTVVLCTGAWTGSLLSQLATTAQSFNGWWPTRPSAQCVATLRLTEQEAMQLKNTPVVLNFSTGFYLFEPTLALEENGETSWQMKIAIHSNGYCTPAPIAHYTGTFPTFDQQHQHTPTHDIHFGTADAQIPPTKLAQLLDELRHVYPHLAQHERVITTRICWYSDTLDENWIIDTLPSHPNVWTFSGDSGHGYKFLPILGDLWQTLAGLRPNTHNWPLDKFSFAHHRQLHDRKFAAQPPHTSALPAQRANLRARL